jgi:FMN phosphatase YigB (HAD superfamily)
VNVRAVIFDVYGTLLEVTPPPNAAASWERLWRERFAMPSRLTLAQFSAACDAITTREHTAARLAARGICPGEILMIGDRLDNDIAPARAQGWQAWQVGRQEDAGWASLFKALPNAHSKT